MSSSVQVVWDQSLTGYDFGRSHPMSPLRIDLTIRLARSLGVLDHANVAVISPPLADDSVLTSVHSAELVDAVRRCALDTSRYEPDFGLGTDDDPCFPGMHEATARVVGGTVAVADAVWRGRVEHGVNITGGLHHAMPDRSSGFCVYNDVAVAIRHLLDQGAERIAYVDVDVHHGDGVQAVFWDDPRVLTVSLHESPRTLFPGTGYPEEVGGRGAEGSAVNVALPPGTTDSGWLRAFHAVVPPLLKAFGPQVLVTQHGCDTHFDDPLAHMALTVDGQRTSYALLHQLAHDLCGGRWVATGGGGYAIVEVVPRSWTHLLAEATGRPVSPETDTPQDWRDHVEVTVGRPAPFRMTDGAVASHVPWETGYDPGDWLDRAVLATRKATFPYHGLDPHW